MNKTHLVFVIAALAASASPSVGFGQGALAPPGPPARTMKTLDQVEPRTIVNSTNTPGDQVSVYVISAPGSYYLTGNITANGKNGISVTADNVTLDLNGFAVTSTSNPAGGIGVVFRNPQQVGSLRNGVLRNGTITGWGGGVEGSGTSMHVTGINVSDCRDEGISLGAFSNGSLVDFCTVSSTGGTSIGATTVSHCSVYNAGDFGIDALTVDNCSADSNGTSSISGYSVTACYGRNLSTASDTAGIHARNVTSSYGDGVSGIVTIVPPNDTTTGTVSNSTGVGSTGDGIHTDVATGSRGESDSGVGLFANYMAMNCVGKSQSGRGIVTSLATNCFGDTASGDIALNANGTATGCRGWQHAGTGQAINTTIAVACTSAGGTIVGNKQLGTP